MFHAPREAASKLSPGHAAVRSVAHACGRFFEVSGRTFVQDGAVVEMAGHSEMSQRVTLAEEFYTVVGLTGDTRPLFVSDDAALYDIQLEADQDVVDRVRGFYGVTLEVPRDFRRPLWQVLDDLQRLRRDQN